MASIREYFETEGRGIAPTLHWTFEDQLTGQSGDMIVKLFLDFDVNAKYISIWVDERSYDLGVLMHILDRPELQAAEKDLFHKGVNVGPPGPQYAVSQKDEKLVYTKCVNFFIDRKLTTEDKASLHSKGSEVGLVVSVRDRDYARIRSEGEDPLAFISHDSRDKEALVRPLANNLTQILGRVWYDEFELSVGDSLRDSIEKGLKRTKKCILVISPNFLSNPGWSKLEFDSVFTRELVKSERVLLPVWHHVSKEQVYEYSPQLANRFALNSKIGIEPLARLLANACRN